MPESVLTMVSTLAGVILGAALSLVSVRITHMWAEKAARKRERAEWAQSVYESGLLNTFDRTGRGLPDSVEMQSWLDLVPPVPYAVDVMHGGAITTVQYRLRVFLGQLYKRRTTASMQGRPLGESFFAYDEVIRADLTAWVHGEKKPRELFTSLELER